MIALALAVFELVGQVMPHGVAAVSVHAANSPYAASTLADAAGSFRFRGLEAGSYTVSVFVPKRGEVRRTVAVGPSTADKRRRVHVRIDTQGEQLSREPAAVVSARSLTVPPRARKEYEAALARLAKRDIDGAVAGLERAVEIKPRFAAALNHLGTIAYQTQRYAEAERRFRQALEADGEAYEPLVNLGGVLINLGNLDEAWTMNVAAVLRRPNDALAQAQLGMTYAGLNKLDLAEKHLKEARRLDPAHFSHPQLHLAEVYIRRNDRAGAADALEDFLRHNPDYPRAAQIRETLRKWRE